MLCSFYKKLLLISIWPLYVNKLPMVGSWSMHLNFDQVADATRNKHPPSEHERRLQARKGDAKSDFSELKSCLNNQLKRAGFPFRFLSEPTPSTI